MINYLNEVVTGGLNPDLTILLDVDYDVGLFRVKDREKDRFDLQGREFFERVRAGYRLLRQNDTTGRWMAIDTSRLTLEEVAARVLELTVSRLTEAGVEPKREVSLGGKER